jgi:TMEM175 potassium channel family protein
MNKTRLEAFSDGVLAIIITIMVLELKVPAGTSWAEVHPALEKLGSYTLSFVYLAIYWGNHHHLLHTVSRVSAKIMWANMHLLFWLSLVPFATAWMGEASFDSISVAVYGTLLLLSAIAYTILSKAIESGPTSHPKLSEVLHKTGAKEILSMTLYLSSIPLAFVEPLISCGLFVIVTIMWIVPNKEIEQLLNE